MSKSDWQCFLMTVMLACSACTHRASEPDPAADGQPRDVMSVDELQGVWIDEDTGLPQFWVRDDSIFFADSVNMGCRLKVRGDTLWLGSDGYCVEEHDSLRLSIVNTLGNTFSLRRSGQAEDTLAFVGRADNVMPVPEVTRSDTVVHHDGHRYHAYITVNPTSVKVYRTTYTADGMAVDNFSYDNVIHLSVYEGRDCLFRSNVEKADFAGLIPDEFLLTAVLQRIDFLFCDREGIHFRASVCVPESASCYAVELCVDYEGHMTQDVRDS